MYVSALTASSSSRYSIEIFTYLASLYSGSTRRTPAYRGAPFESSQRSIATRDKLEHTYSCRRSAERLCVLQGACETTPESRSMPARVCAAAVQSSCCSCSAARASRTAATCSSKDTSRGATRASMLRHLRNAQGNGAVAADASRLPTTGAVKPMLESTDICRSYLKARRHGKAHYSATSLCGSGGSCAVVCANAESSWRLTTSGTVSDSTACVQENVTEQCS